MKYSIESEGLYYKIVKNPQSVLLDGHHRLKICDELGVAPEFEVKQFDSKLSEELYIRDSNAKRRHYSDFELVEQGLKSDELRKERARLKEIAKRRLEAILPKKGQKGFQPILGSFEPSIDVDKEIAKRIGVTKTSFVKARYIIEHGSDEMKEKVRKGKTESGMSLSYGYKMAKRAQDDNTASELPKGVFDVILADPGWRYDLGLRGDPADHYKVEDAPTISELKIPAAKDSILFLWATGPKIREALQVMEQWGFSYKTQMIWVKDKIGLGHYVRGKHELLLIGTKGSIGTPREANRPPSVFYAPRRKHSQKPDEIYGIIERMYPNRAYLELYARPEERRPRWTYWGLEARVHA